jgi:uncharacterized protein
MPKSIYINLITKDLVKSTAFYQAIGCTKNDMFSDENACSMMWDENIIFMLLSEEFARHFDDGKQLVDQKKTVSAYYALSCDSKEEVDAFCAKAIEAGGRVYTNKYNEEVAGDFMYSYEVEDTDGYILEPNFMDLSQFSQGEESGVSMKCDLCDFVATGRTFQEWMTNLMPHYMQAHSEVMNDKSKTKEDQQNWMDENRKRFEEIQKNQ